MNLHAHLYNHEKASSSTVKGNAHPWNTVLCLAILMVSTAQYSFYPANIVCVPSALHNCMPANTDSMATIDDTDRSQEPIANTRNQHRKLAQHRTIHHEVNHHSTTNSSVHDSSVHDDGGDTTLSSRSSIVSQDDYIMRRDYDASPVVIPQHKLIFFTTPKVGCTIWKKLFRRMMGFDDWNDPAVAHNPNLNGLIYLSNYSVEEAQLMLSSPDWTKAMWVRDPKERFLSAYLDKAVSNDGKHLRNCCRYHDDAAQGESCIRKAQTSLEAFYNLVTTQCPHDAHWLPQSQRVDKKYWQLLRSGNDGNNNSSNNNNNNNTFFVGHLETKSMDAKRLLRHLKVWREYGASGWGPPASASGSLFGAAHAISHRTEAGNKMSWYYIPKTERLVDAYYKRDYQLSILGLEERAIQYPAKSE